MSTSNPIHMRIYTFAWRYSRERRMGASRVAALRAAWAWVTTPIKFAAGAVTVGGLTIRALDGTTVVSTTRATAPVAPSAE